MRCSTFPHAHSSKSNLRFLSERAAIQALVAHFRTLMVHFLGHDWQRQVLQNGRREGLHARSLQHAPPLPTSAIILPSELDYCYHYYHYCYSYKYYYFYVEALRGSEV